MARSSVEGLGEFRRHMEGLDGAYVLIGGIACDILLSEADLPFRATHDFDTVLIADARLPKVAAAVWSLVHDGGYRYGWGKEENACLYRFTNPTKPGYPRMIEVFSRKPNFLSNTKGIEVAPLPAGDEVSSLSAIILDDAYYGFMLDGIRTVEGISVLDELHLIPFKAKAYLDLNAKREQGEQIDSKKVKKHKRDALRLAQLLTGNENIALPNEIAADMRAFILNCKSNPGNLKQIGIAGVTMAEILEVMRRTYRLGATD